MVELKGADGIMRNKRPKYILIFEDIKNKINNGEYKSNSRLPSKRDLAMNLNVSINTIMNAYSLLLDEGYIYSKEKKGYFVSDQPLVIAKEDDNIAYEVIDPSYKYDFTSKNVEPLFQGGFKKAIKEAINNNSYLDRAGLLGSYSLRLEIAKHLRANRGISANADNIVIGSGMEMLEPILRLIPIDNIILENPGYHRLADMARGINKKISYQELDSSGVIVPKGQAILYTTPFNQFPTGIKMTIPRKKEIISYLNNTDSYLIEDDFDAEFRINQSPTTALYSLDNERVIFFSTFSATMFPGLRIAYSILPNRLAIKYKEYYKGFQATPNSLIAEALGGFIKNGGYASIVNKRKKLYLEKRRLIEAELLANGIKYNSKANYLSVLIDINRPADNSLLARLKENGILIEALSMHDHLKRASSILILGYTAIPKDKIKEGISLLKKIIGS